ncbi:MULTISPECIES: folylpolyglutamate synthase/dihydrofolate synthase family protein [unclassified Flavobacterium]|uniref:bifunctional folylpolyglutamate synthase/dihydrofolate synthase n=1 Tax=unclassified Flavobacterium TaxID=196869 RepID=UPI0013D3204E|nr:MULTISPECIES: folylpolyglutamate synthase/dihydrofolate synthase family protein [unclassified Flavobacterium]MBA5792380.1 bifunctional folylpolyglutamate synthase/dihydrofolate synthase [Flavobacterium sp. xlx-221]
MTNYKETVEWMFAQLPMFQQLGASAYKKDLTNTLLLCKHLNHPETKFKSVHIGGTNGKGSTSSLIASVLQEAGYKVGLYTSPHLVDFRERIKINGEMISEKFVVDFIDTNKSFFETNKLSFFEMTVGMAFDYFAKEQVDVAIIEVGLGGRLDSTNVITPLVSVITNIGWDHTNLLGNTLEQIAFEKAGIIKKNIPVVIGEFTNETKPVFISKAQNERAPIYFASEEDISVLESDLKGNYQIHNKKAAYKTLQLLKSTFEISDKAIENGFLIVQKNTGLLGRWSVLSQEPLIVADTAHNKNGLEIVMQQVHQQTFNTLYMVFGVVNDKDIDSIIPYLPKNAVYFLAKPNVPRGLDAEILKQKLVSEGFNCETFNSIQQAYNHAKKVAQPDDMIYIGGSTFVVAEVFLPKA